VSSHVLLQSYAINLQGFYGHAGNAYASTSLPEASEFFSGEVAEVNDAAKAALESGDSTAQVDQRVLSYELLMIPLLQDDFNLESISYVAVNFTFKFKCHSLRFLLARKQFNENAKYQASRVLYN